MGMNIKLNIKLLAQCLAYMPGTIMFLLTPLSHNESFPSQGGAKPSTPHHPMADLKSSPVPRGVVVGGPLQMSKLDLIGGLGAAHAGRELHLQELVGLVPVHLWGVGDKGLAPPHQPHPGKIPTTLPPATSVWKRT